MEVEPRGGVTGREGTKGGEPGQGGDKGKREARGQQQQRDKPCTQRLTQGKCGAQPTVACGHCEEPRCHAHLPICNTIECILRRRVARHEEEVRQAAGKGMAPGQAGHGQGKGKGAGMGRNGAHLHRCDYHRWPMCAGLALVQCTRQAVGICRLCAPTCGRYYCEDHQPEDPAECGAWRQPAGGTRDQEGDPPGGVGQGQGPGPGQGAGPGTGPQGGGGQSQP